MHVTVAGQRRFLTGFPLWFHFNADSAERETNFVTQLKRCKRLHATRSIAFATRHVNDRSTSVGQRRVAIQDFWWYKAAQAVLSHLREA